MAASKAQMDAMLRDVEMQTELLYGPRRRREESGVTVQSTPGVSMEDEIAILRQAMQYKTGNASDDFAATPANPKNLLKSQLLHDPSFMTALNSNKCNVCYNLDPRGHPLANTFEVDGTILSTVELQFVDATARIEPGNECGYCQMIKKAVNKFFPFWAYVKNDHAGAPPTLTTIVLTENQPALLTVQHFIDGKLVNTGIELFKDPASTIDSLPALGSVSTIADNAESDETFSFIQKCLDCCTNGPDAHPLCQLDECILPKRLISIDWDGSNPKAFQEHAIIWKVVCPRSDTGKYAALSHCWGKDPLPKLEQLSPGNAGNMSKRFQWSSASILPRTFQDGMYTALRLGLVNIWIDSLCIIQNCPSDWATEAAKMGSYYQNAHLTIAAASSEAGAIPFLRPRPSEFKPVKIRYYGPKKKSIFSKMITSSTAVNARRSSRKAGNTHGQSVSWARTQPSNPKIPGPLATRVWTLQEHILSTRIIHFTDEGVRWECRTCNKAEDDRRCLPSYLQAWNRFTEGSLESRDEQQSFWRQILIDYTSRDLSFRKDILIALSGVAERMHRIHRQPYVAGMWGDRLVEDLCWTLAGGYGDKAPCTHHDDIELPTWSWISVRHAINYPIVDEKGVFTPYSTVLWQGCTTDPEDPNSFGRVLSGSLLIAGPIVECELTAWGQSSTAHGQSNSLSGGIDAYIYQDAPLVEDDATALLGLMTCKTVRRMRQSVPFTLEESKFSKTSVYCMHLGGWVPDSQPFSLSGVEHEFVLVLARSARVPDAFERIGIVKSDLVFASAFDKAIVVPLRLV